MATSVEHKHPNYVLIWIYLAALTGVELAVALMRFLPRNALILTLVVLAAWKALLVALYFMHLKFDEKILRRVFFFGALLAAAIYSGVLAILHFWAPHFR